MQMITELDLEKFSKTKVPRELNAVEKNFLESFSNDQDFNRKIRAKMALDNRLILSKFADKLTSSQIMSNFVPNELLPGRPNIFGSAEELRKMKLPQEFVLKVNHASGGVIIVSKRAQTALRLPKIDEVRGSIDWDRYVVHPDNFEVEVAIKMMSRWLKSSYKQTPNTIREWAYSQIEPRAFVENYAEDFSLAPRQVEFYCFQGKVKAAFFSVRSKTLKHSIYKAFFRTEELNYSRIHSKLSIQQWQQILNASEAISSYTDIVRVDWLLTTNGPIFSELTNYPGGGGTTFGDSSLLSNAQNLDLFSKYWGEIGPY
jgi:hypothetical protein